jgi:hypothetical protein
MQEVIGSAQTRQTRSGAQYEGGSLGGGCPLCAWPHCRVWPYPDFCVWAGDYPSMMKRSG